MGLRDLFRRRQDGEPELNAVSRVEDPVEGDTVVLEQLREVGADLSKPRDARFYLYVRTGEDAEAAAASVREHGYEVEVSPAAGELTEHPWLVLANRDLVVDEDSIEEARRLFDGLAERYSGDYDGWEAAAD
jgi:hypothetical protein